jgi:hypothetical protein
LNKEPKLETSAESSTNSETPQNSDVAETQVNKAAETKLVSTFDPVVIVVGKTGKAAEPKAGIKQADSSPIVPAEITSDVSPEKISQNNATTPNESSNADVGNTRKRVIDGLKITEEIGEKCDIYASQDNVSILNDGGNLGILIGIEGIDSKDINIENSSPEDISVSLQPDITGMKNRSFFVIRSRSTRTGVYNIVFSGGCGSKIIPVTVR